MKYIVWILVIAALAAGGYYFWQKKKPMEEGPESETKQEQAVKEETNNPAGETTPSGSPSPSPSPQGRGMNEAGGENQEVQEISVTSGYAFFTPKEMTLKKGRPVKINIQSSGNHTFTIDELGVNKSLADGANVVEFTPDSAGVFIYYCATPGHRQAGQWGTVTVEE